MQKFAAGESETQRTDADNLPFSQMMRFEGHLLLQGTNKNKEEDWYHRLTEKNFKK